MDARTETVTGVLTGGTMGGQVCRMFCSNRGYTGVTMLSLLPA